jgi:mRNA interferase HigB
MKLIGRQDLEAFAKRHAPCKRPLQSWVKIVEEADWKSFQDIKAQFRSADVLSGNRVIFDIKGNHFRLVTVVAYRQGILQVLWIGTHAEYSKKKWD